MKSGSKKYKDIVTRHFEQMGVDIKILLKLVMKQSQKLTQKITSTLIYLLQIIGQEESQPLHVQISSLL